MLELRESTWRSGPFRLVANSPSRGQASVVGHAHWCGGRWNESPLLGRATIGVHWGAFVTVCANSVVAINFHCHDRGIVRGRRFGDRHFASLVIDCIHERRNLRRQPRVEQTRVARALARLAPRSQDPTVLGCAEASGGIAKLGGARSNRIRASRSASKVPGGLTGKLAPLARTLHGIRIRWPRRLAHAPGRAGNAEGDPGRNLHVEASKPQRRRGSDRRARCQVPCIEDLWNCRQTSPANQWSSTSTWPGVGCSRL